MPSNHGEGEAPAEPQTLQSVLPPSGSAGASPSRADLLSRRTFCAVAWGTLLVAATTRAAEKNSPLKLTSPIARQVFQREGYLAASAHDHEPGGPKLGEAQVPVRGSWTGAVPARLEVRTVLQDGCTGRALDWTKLAEIAAAGEFQSEIIIPAGGWYRLEVRMVNAAGETVGSAAINPIGVGEVFLISGQSYAAGANDEHQRIEDPLERSVLLDTATKTWRTAHDPFPHVDNGGTIWPAFANAIQPLLRVPVGLINVAVGGTASRQWMPGEALYQRFLDGGRAAGRFRFVLWQQGESDVIENIPTATYVERLEIIRAGLAKDWGFSPRWLLAKSTLHPTVYNRPVEEGRIRDAIGQLWKRPGFGPGPDTDILAGENRGGPQSRRHFSAIGQRRAGLMWFASAWAAMHEETIR
jgi:hypothetical protein